MALIQNFFLLKKYCKNYIFIICLIFLFLRLIVGRHYCIVSDFKSFDEEPQSENCKNKISRKKLESGNICAELLKV